jgi:hypothetical protein
LSGACSDPSLGSEAPAARARLVNPTIQVFDQNWVCRIAKNGVKVLHALGGLLDSKKRMIDITPSDGASTINLPAFH